MQRHALFIVAGILMLGLVGCGSAGSVSGTVAHSSATHAPTATVLPTATTDTGAQGAVGDTISVTAGSDVAVSCTLVSARTSAGGEFDQPSQGNQYVVVTVTLNNTGPSSYDYNPLDFYLLSGGGNLSQSTFASDIAPKGLDFGTLVSGGSVTGQLVFQSAVGDHAAELTWQPTFGTPKDKFTWKLGI